MKGRPGEKTISNKQIVSFRDLMILLDVFPADKLSIKLLRTTLSELIPKNVYIPEIAASDTLTDDMIINADEYSASHTCSYCGLNCRQAGSYFPCFLFEAGIKFPNLIYKKDPYKQTALVGDCFRSDGKEDRTYYTIVYFYDYIYYLGTGESRNGRGHGKMSVHFQKRFFDHVINAAASGESDITPAGSEERAPFLSQDFLRLIETFIDRHQIRIDYLLEDSLITAFPDACKTATAFFPKRALSVRDLLAVLIALSLSDPDSVKEYLGNTEEEDLPESDPQESAQDEQPSESEEDSEGSFRTPEEDTLRKRFYKHFSVCRAMHVALALLISGTDLFYIVFDYFYPGSTFSGTLLKYFLPLQPFLLLLCYFIKLRASTMRLVYDNASDPGFSAYLDAFKHSFIRLPSATDRFSSLTAPEDEALGPVRICVGAFGVLSSSLICFFSFLTDTQPAFTMGVTVLLIILTVLYTSIDNHYFFVSFDRTRRHTSSVEGKASAIVGKFYFFKDRHDDYDPINTRFMIDTFYYPAACSRLIYHKAYTNKRDKAYSIVLLTLIWDIFACLCLFLNGEKSYATESAVITIVTVCFLCGPFSSHKGYIYSMLRSKYLSVFCPPHEYSAALRKDILLHTLNPHDIISGKKAFLRSSALYDTKADDSYRPDFNPEIRISYDCFYRFSTLRVLTASVLLLTVGFYSLLTSLGLETEKLLCLFIGVILYGALSGGLFDNVSNVYSSARFRRRQEIFFRKNNISR